jgi:hypothetical protein
MLYQAWHTSLFNVLTVFDARPEVINLALVV